MATIWVDNVNGVDTNDGRTQQYAVKTLYRGIQKTTVGDTLRICYTGTDYTYESSLGGYVINKQGTSWASPGLVIEGYDTTGGKNRPTLLNSANTADDGYIFSFGGASTTTASNYIIVHDLKFILGGKVEASSNAIRLMVTLSDSPTYFKIYNCWFVGSSTSIYPDVDLFDTAVYSEGGSRLYIEMYQCYFNNTMLGCHLTNTTSPSSFGGYFHHNLYVVSGAGEAEGFLKLELTKYPGQVMADVTIVNNTYANTKAAVTGTAYNFNDTSFLDNSATYFEFKRNICFGCDKMLSMGSGYPYNLSSSRIGSNSMGYCTSAENYYVNAFDTSETVSGTMYADDSDVGYNKAVNDYTVYFRNKDTTFYWEETGWMYVPDLRPIHVDMTGVLSGRAVARGALNGGLYIDTSCTTANTTKVEPYAKPNFYSGSGVTLENLAIDDNTTTKAVFAFSSAKDGTFSYIGSPGVPYLKNATVFWGSGDRVQVDTDVYKKIYPSGAVEFPCSCKIVGRFVCASAGQDRTSTWESSYTSGSHSRTTLPPTHTEGDVWEVYVKIDSYINPDATAWLYAGSITYE